ncbi:MAG: gamma-butyrobetaine hydroxylase-like domain-containing protein, partial [Sneathiella sp.]
MTISDLLVRTGALVVTWAGGASATFPTLWLRDNCPSGLHPQTHERLLDLLTLDLSPVLMSAQLKGEHVELSYEDGHVSLMPVALLSAHRPGQPAADPAAIAPQLWRADIAAAGVPRHAAAPLLSEDLTLGSWMRETAAFGLTIVEALEDKVSAGMDVARRIGFLRKTNFGTTFEVVNKPDPNNLAYTSV